MALEKATNGRFNKMDAYSKVTLEHEEQHAFNKIIDQGYSAELKKVEKNTKRYIKEFGEDPNSYTDDIWKKYLDTVHDRQIEIERRVKDEISAYIRDGRSAEEIRKTLLNPDTIYEYGFDYRGGNKEKKEWSEAVNL